MLDLGLRDILDVRVVRVLFFVVLVVVLGHVKTAVRLQLRDDEFVVLAAQRQLGHHVFSGLFLFRVVVKDGAAVLLAGVGPLTVELRGVVGREENGEQGFVIDFFSVVVDLHRLCVLGSARRHLAIGRIGLGSAGVARKGLLHAQNLVERCFHAPKASARKCGGVDDFGLIFSR